MAMYITFSAQKIRSLHQSEQYYKEVSEGAASYNARLCSERRQRLPFLDSQTGVAQNHSNLWIPSRYRGPGQCHGQLYSYPARRWKKKCSLPLPDIPLPRIKPADADASESDMHAISTVENPAVVADADSKDVGFEETAYREEYYNEWENLSEPPDAGEIDHRNSDSSDFEETYIKKKVRRIPAKKPKTPAGGGRGRKKDKLLEAELAAEKDKPYGCDSCGARYKTRPGLTYHLTHSHNKPPPPDEDMEPPPPSPKTTPSYDATPAKRQSKSGSKYCDFCLGDELENKKTGNKEEMVSCADCGRCGHPTCLQFTPNMIISVKKYPWQCIECKSCGICGTSDNDDQLLFCDDCDRGYHMYCLNPPLSEPPEGSWSCHLCIKEFYGGHKPDVMEDS